MRVSHSTDHVTHAVIASATAIDFGISDSPEFFNILSSTLYSDQILAVVRETLCNLWDAHIEAQIENVFGEVSLTDKELIFRDFGNGIPQDKIGPVYGKYGGSTKVANGKVTGGFGLGCKSPFAYVDDFEVTSWSQGKKTIYRISKSNAEVGGKPSIIPIVTVPTSETGLQVKMAIKNPADRKRFETLIKRIVQNGAMKIKLNGEELPTLPFDDMKHGFMLTRQAILENQVPVAIRYGNVIYPIEREESYSDEWDQIIEFLHDIENANSRWSRGNPIWTLVLQAAPNTITVTPSRESLAMVKTTLSTITELMQSFLKASKNKMEKESFTLLDKQMELTYIAAAPKDLFRFRNALPHTFMDMRDDSGRVYNDDRYRRETVDYMNMTDYPQFARRYISHRYPAFQSFKKRDMLLRLKALEESGFGGQRVRGLIQSFRKEFLRQLKMPSRGTFRSYRGKDGRDRYDYDDIHINQSTWFQQRVTAPLIRALDESETNLRSKNLFVFSELDREGSRHTPRSNDRGEFRVKEAKKFTCDRIDMLMPFLRNIIILSFNRMDVSGDAVNGHPICKYWVGDAKDCLVYVVPRADNKVEEARQFFHDRGMYVIDLTIEQKKAYDRMQAEKRVKPTAITAKPKKKGIPVLGSMLTENGIYNNRLPFDYESETVTYTQTPEFYVKDGRRNENNSLPDMTITGSDALIKLYGSKGGVVVNQNQEDRYKAAGAIPMKEYVLAKLVDEYANNPRIREFLAFDPRRKYTSSWACKYKAQTDWIDIIRRDEDLAEYFGLVDNRTARDKLVMAVFEQFKSNHWLGKNGELDSIVKTINAIKVNDVVQQLFDLLFTSPYMGMLDASGVLHCMKADRPKRQRDMARDTLLAAIEG